MGGSVAETLLDFVWTVNVGGYRWVRARPLSLGDAVDEEAPEADYLVEQPADGKTGYKVRSYQPLIDEPALFLTFAALESSPEQIRDFATRFGLLGDNLTQTIADAGRQWGDMTVSHTVNGHEIVHRVGLGELLSDWRQELRDMREAVEIWHMAEAGDTTSLSRHIRWSDDKKAVGYESDPARPIAAPYHAKLLASPEHGAWALDVLPPGDVIGPALLFVQRVINEHLSPRASPQLSWDVRRGRPRLQVKPVGLIGALWLQFAQAVHGQVEYRSCRECGKWFEIHPDIARSNRLFCSTACRSKAYRKRQEQARRLHAEGRDVLDIAERLESDIATVRGWLAQDRTAEPKRRKR
jgi:hypothetical protein